MIGVWAEKRSVLQTLCRYRSKRQDNAYLCGSLRSDALQAIVKQILLFVF